MALPFLFHYKSLFTLPLRTIGVKSDKDIQCPSFSPILFFFLPRWICRPDQLTNKYKHYANPIEWGTEQNWKNEKHASLWVQDTDCHCVHMRAKMNVPKGNNRCFQACTYCTLRWTKKWHSLVLFSGIHATEKASKAENETKMVERTVNKRKREKVKKRKREQVGRRRCCFRWDGWMDKRIVNERLWCFVLFIFGRSSLSLRPSSSCWKPFRGSPFSLSLSRSVFSI